MTQPPVIRPAVPADTEPVAVIFEHCVTTSVATFEEIPPSVGHWRRRLDGLGQAGLPFLIDEAGGEVRGFAYASPWRPKPVRLQAGRPPDWGGRKHGRWIDTVLMQRELGGDR